MNNKINLLTLTLLITGAIDSIRNLPASALFGSTLIFFFILSALLFLIPTALVSAELTANTSEGGIYQWARLAFGGRIGFLAIWLQWINNLIWFPTILSFIAGTASYLIDPALAQNKIYLICSILILFWGLTFINLKGINLSAKFTSVCTLMGLIVPMAAIILLFFIWIILKKPIQIDFTLSSMLPRWSHSENWIALTAIMLGFCGMELATVHIKEVKNPQKTFPKALIFSTILILFTMILGSLAIACVLPYQQINLINGTIETFSYFLSAYHLAWLLPLMTILLVVGSLGGVLSWVISPIRGLSQAASDGFLPPFFQKVNKQGAAQNLLIAQGIIVSVVCLAFLLFPSINASYWLLTALSTQLYMLMYVLMFIAAIVIKNKIPFTNNIVKIPGKNWGFRTICGMGLVGCVLTLIAGFVPPVGLNIGSKFYYESVFCIGALIMILPVFAFYRYEKRQKRALLKAEIKLERPTDIPHQRFIFD